MVAQAPVSAGQKKNAGSMKAAGIAGNAVGLFFDALVVAISVQGHCGLRQLAFRCE